MEALKTLLMMASEMSSFDADGNFDEDETSCRGFAEDIKAL